MLDVRGPLRPLLRLLAAGGGLALLANALPDAPGGDPAARHRIVIDRARLAAAERGLIGTIGRAPDPTERAALLAAEVDDEILYREALRLGLADGDVVVQHRIAGNLAFVEDGPPPQPGASNALAGDMLQQDLVVRRRLIERMRAHLEREVLADEPDDATLAAALHANATRFALPARVRLALAPVPEGAPADGAARAAATGEVDPIAVRELPPQSERDLARLHGAALARAAFATTPGSWSAPVAAAAGRYRILVREHEPARLPPLDAVRNQVRELVRRERADAAVRRKLDEMRSGYAVSLVAGPAERPG